ncbi:MAG: transposase [archaeon]
MTISSSTNNKLALPGKFVRIVKKHFFLGLGIKIAKNAKYDHGKLFLLLNYMFSHNMSAEEASKEMKVDYPDALVASADRILGRLKTVQRHAVERAFDKTIKHLMKKFLKTNAVVAIDYHDVPYYGDRNDCNVLGSKHQRGTNWCHQYASLEIVVGEHRLTIAVNKLSEDEREKAIVIRELIQTAKRYVHIDLILIDRAFYSVECIRTLKAQRLKFIMPVPRNNAIKKTIKENDNDLPIVIKNAVGKEKNCETYNLAMIRGKTKGKRIAPVHCFATNYTGKTAEQISELYRKRWSIETGYKSKKKFRVRTSTTSNIIRMLYFYFECLFYNIWCETKNLIPITIDSFKQMMRNIIKEEINPIT